MQPDVSSKWSLAGPLADRAGHVTLKNWMTLDPLRVPVEGSGTRIDLTAYHVLPSSGSGPVGPTPGLPISPPRCQ
jgi:hypothetical protein